VRGWVWPKPGGGFVDVRARAGDRVSYGIHGIPRADLAAHFNTGRPVALAEFHVVVDLAPGAQTLELEALEIDGRWRPFQRLALTVTPSDPPVHFAVPSGPLRWIDYGHGLKRLLRLAARQPEASLATLADELAGELPWPRVVRDAPAPLIGYVDEPASVCCCRFGRIPAFGHLFHPELAVRRILGTVDLQAWQPLAIRQPSPGPAAFYPQHRHAQACGFTGLVDVPAQLPNPVCLRLYAELEDGSLHLGPVVRTRLHPAEEEKLPGPARAGFDEAVAAWEAALARRGITIAREPELERYVASLRTEHARARPVHDGGAIPALVESPAAAAPLHGRRVLLATHGLSLQGAPRFLLELGRALAKAGARIGVLTAEDGPLRAEFTAVGADIAVADCGAVMQAASAEAAAQAVAELARRPEWAAADVVVANSFTTFWAVHAARAARRPVVLYVHESTTPAVFFDTRVSPAVIGLAEQAFGMATLVSFTTAATRNCHLGYGRPERHRLTPGWVDVAALDEWQRRQDRAALRRSFGLGEGELLVCNIGTVSDRKGQHTFVRAVDLFRRRHPALAARTRFLLLGGRDSVFDTMLADSLAELRLDRLAVHPETADYLRYYLAADLFACSSYEESSPRVVFEAMALGRPILASAVHGVPELVRDGLEAALLPGGDTAAWCEGLARLLAAPAVGAELAARARARAENLYAPAVILPRHLGLIAAAMGS
jgi:glycosyltransferase involved in cell wall biosynthesis